MIRRRRWLFLLIITAIIIPYLYFYNKNRASTTEKNVSKASLTELPINISNNNKLARPNSFQGEIIKPTEDCSLTNLNKCTSKELRSIYGNQMEVEVPTPTQFIEVPKVQQKSSRKILKPRIPWQHLKRAFPDTDPKSFKKLAKRAESFPEGSVRYTNLFKSYRNLAYSL